MKVCSTCQRCYDDIVSSCAESEHPELSEVREGNTQIIAGYRLEMVLESGIKGETYRARRTDADQSCLIRILSGTEETKNQFLQDAKTAATIFNESIVDVYEAGSLESGEVFVVAEEPGGQTARELLNNVGVPQLLTTVQVVRQAAEAVHALHLTGLIHRAIRPENIILTTDAEHRLLVRIQNVDLGGVIEHAIVSNKFLIDSAIDSLRYFAPDQFSGESASVKTDVYSLGIVLYEMLSGAPPFDAEKGSGLIDMHRNQRPAEVSIDNFDLRMLLTHTLMESLQKQSPKRQSSANAFARQLRHIEQLALHSPTPPAAGIGSSAPPPIAMVAAVPASAAAQPARIVEIPKTTQVVKVAAAKVESQPMPTKVAAEPIQELRIEPCPSVLVVHEIEVLADEGLNGLSEQLPDIPDMLGTRPIVKSEKVETDPPKSRLKRLKKQLRTFTSPLVIAPAGNNILNSEIVEAQSEVTSVGHEQVVNHAVPIAPRKIIWEQPEDDIPSMDEAMEVLLQGDLSTVASASESTASEPASKTPRKIEWLQPEDDIPSIEEACEVLATEQVAEVPIVSAVLESAVPEPVSIAPKKIEWVQPEDDIPSIDDVGEVLVTEQVAEVPIVSAPFESAVPEPDSIAPKKIEWVQPEDDIPSIDEVREVLATEQAVEVTIVTAVFESTAPEPVSIAPKKIEWVQPEDDIPSIDDVREALATEIVEVPIVPAVFESVAPAPVAIPPKKIEWVQPEDDNPSIEETLEALSQEQVPDLLITMSVQDIPAEVPSAAKKVESIQIEDDISTLEETFEALSIEQMSVVPATPRGVMSEPIAHSPKKIALEQAKEEIPSMKNVPDVLAEEQVARSTFEAPVGEVIVEAVPVPSPKKIEWVQPEDDIPLMDDVLQVAAQDSTEVAAVQLEEIEVAGPYNEPLPAKNPVVVPAFEPEQEEITLVSPPRRITIDWEQPKPWETLSKQIEFFPTLLGEVDTKRKADHTSEPFFSDYYDEAEPRSSDHYRSLLIGSGFIVLIVLFLFGNDSVWTYLQGGSAADSVAVQTSPAKQTFPQSGQTTMPNEQRQLKSFEKAKTGDDVDTDVLKSGTVKVVASESEKPVSGLPENKSVEPNKQKPAKNSDRNAGKAPLVPSTLVISSDDGKVSSKVEPQKRKATESTRPRIVDNPQP